MRQNHYALMGALIAAFWAVSGQSLWIDEAYSALKAQSPNLQTFWKLNMSQVGSDQQMILFMVALWGWEKLCGSSEWALRSFNILFWGLSLFTWKALPGKPIKYIQWIWITSACSAFLWMYLDEARPYMMQYAGTVCMWVAVLRCKESLFNRWTWLLLYGGGILVCGASLLGIPFAGCLILLFLWFAYENREFCYWKNASWILATAGFLAIMVMLMAYYAWIFSLGTRASDVGKTGISNLGFAFYELLGMEGLGPGRLEMREKGVRAFLPWAPLLILYAAVLFGSLSLALRKSGEQVVRHRRLLIFGALSAGIPAAFILLLGWKIGFRLLGRHLTPVEPVIVMVMAWVFMSLWDRGRSAKAIVGAGLVLLLLSCLNFRLLPIHAKDDYKGAAREAQTVLDNQGVVWWAADGAAAQYYRLSPVHAWEKGLIFHANSRDTSYLDSLPKPALVVLSKEDIYDIKGALRQWLQLNHFEVKKKFQAFTLWEKKTDL